MPLALAAVGPLLLLIGLPFIPGLFLFSCFVGQTHINYFQRVSQIPLLGRPL